MYTDMVRGMRIEEALAALSFTPSPIAHEVAKVIKSAAANAENNFHMNIAELRISRIFADEAKTLKRWKARSRGRASPILKRSSHITVIVSDSEA